jgi:signal recognition particle receptor subunit beta
VVESNNVDRLDEARDELLKILQEEDLSAAPVLVLANKQDVPAALTPAQIADHMGLPNITGRKWFI